MKSRRNMILVALILIFSSYVSAAQPKIIEVTDSFGNTFDTSGSDNGWNIVTVDEELVLKDKTEITLCISESKAESKENITYDFEALKSAQEYDKTSTTDNCNTWELSKKDYTSQIGFRLRVGNGDEIEYSHGNRDYMVDVKYTNPVLRGETSESQNFIYDTVEISQSRLEKLKKQADSGAKVSVPEGQKLVDKDRWKELQEGSSSSDVSDLEDTIQQKNNKISELQERPESSEISELRNRIDEKNEKISNLEETISRLKDEVEVLNSSIENLDRTNEGSGKEATGDDAQNYSESGKNKSIQKRNSTIEENIGRKEPGFVEGFLNSIFGN